MLEGGVPFDNEGENPAFLGEVVEGRDGVEECRGELWFRSRCRPTRYDKGGGGAKGPSSSFFNERDPFDSVVSDLFEIMKRHILANPPLFFSNLGSAFLPWVGSSMGQTLLLRFVKAWTPSRDRI
jgi:hypothetical protein